MPRRDIDATKALGYRKHPGMIAWLLHRISGVLLVLYVILHMLNSAGVMSIFDSFIKNICVEAVIVIMFAWHAANGIRIMFMEFFGAAERSKFKQYLAVFSIIAVLIAVFGLYYIKAYIDQESASAVEVIEETAAPAGEMLDNTSNAIVEGSNTSSAPEENTEAQGE